MEKKTMLRTLKQQTKNELYNTKKSKVQRKTNSTKPNMTLGRISQIIQLFLISEDIIHG